MYIPGIFLFALFPVVMLLIVFIAVRANRRTLQKQSRDRTGLKLPK